MTAESRALRMATGSRGEPRKRAKKEEPARGTKKKKTTRKYRGKDDTGGW